MTGESIDIAAVLGTLARKRPIFHSEKDFQLAFGLELKALYPQVEIALETRPEPGVRLDLQMIDPSRGATVAIELKYLTRGWQGAFGGQVFEVANQNAYDYGRYDVIRDIARVERFTQGRKGWTGYVVVLSNVPAFWGPPTDEPTTNDLEFRIHDGRELGPGSLRWVTLTASTKGRESDIELRGMYRLAWSDYSLLDESTGGRFRSLIVAVSDTSPEDRPMDL